MRTLPLAVILAIESRKACGDPVTGEFTAGFRTFVGIGFGVQMLVTGS